MEFGDSVKGEGGRDERLVRFVIIGRVEWEVMTEESAPSPPDPPTSCVYREREGY